MSLPGIDLLELERYQRQEHHEMFRRLRAEAPIYWHEHPKGRGFWNLTKHADVVTVGRQAQRFSSEIGGISILDPEEYEGEGGGADQRGLMMLYTDPPKHTRYRHLVQKGFTPRMVTLLEQHLQAKAVAIVDNIIERGECDFVEDLASELPLQAIAEIMGVPQEDRRLLFQWSNALIGADDPDYASNNGAEGANDSMTAAMELYMYANALAKARATDPRDDIVTKLINAEIDGDKLSELEFDMFMLLLTVAGNETTRNTTAWGMWGLLQHPDELAKLKADPDTLLAGGIEEILRWASPVYHFRRTAVTDTELLGQEIKANDKVVIWYISANRDDRAAAPTPSASHLDSGRKEPSREPITDLVGPDLADEAGHAAEPGRGDCGVGGAAPTASGDHRRCVGGPFHRSAESDDHVLDQIPERPEHGAAP